MGTDFDEGSFKKARSYLLVFSTLLLALWYFKAEMNTLSILGNSIKFTANTENLWLVLAAANTYFFFRYVQHLPLDWSTPSKDVEQLFNATLISLTGRLHRQRNIALARADFEGDENSEKVTRFKVKPVGEIYYPQSYDPESGGFKSIESDHEVIFLLPVTWRSGNRECSSTGVTNMVKPHKLVVLVCRIIAFAKGVFLAPWFSEHLFPMIYAFIAIGVGLWRWCQIN